MVEPTNEALEIKKLAQESVVDGLLDGPKVPVPASILVDGQQEIAVRGQADQSISLVDAQAEGLLDHYVFSRQQQAFRQLSMAARRCRDLAVTSSRAAT